MWEWVKKGVPLRIEIGPRDVDSGGLMLSRRDRGPKDKASMTRAELAAQIVGILEDMQKGLRDRARAFRDESTKVIDTRKDLDAFFTPKNEKDIHGGFALSGWCGDAACETAAKDALKITIRCIPLGGYEGAPWEGHVHDKGSCVICGKPSERRVIFAKSY
jgi:prolyl-tRNA synthetase